MKRILARFLHRLRRLLAGDLADLAETSLLLAAGLQVERVKKIGEVQDLREVEFRVFSQWGEDGIIQYLVNRVPLGERSFVEFGVENYVESNTRFLLLNDNWRGLVLDGSRENIDYIRNDRLYWRHELAAECRFITRENINEILEEQGFRGDIGLLSIDIDGNDYWVWERIEAIRPRIVVCEYNSVFGSRRAVSIPYDPDFVRTRAHYSNLYFGASLPALCRLAAAKGYDFVGSNSAGSNAFFVRSDLAHGLRTLTATEGYVESRLRESRDRSGRLSHLSGPARAALIGELPVHDVEQDRDIPLREAL